MEDSEPDIFENADENMHKTSAYVQTVVALHNLRDKTKEAVESLQEKSLSERVNNKWNETRRSVFTRTRNFFSHPENVTCEHIPQKYGYVFRPKSRWELVLLGGTVCGIEFCYSAETAFVTPILLSLGLNIKFVTMIWCLSPLIGFFLTPLLGSLSDSCDCKFGRRRPFILLLSVGILLGLILVPNGHRIGTAIGDTPNIQRNINPFANTTYTLNDTFDDRLTSSLQEISNYKSDGMQNDMIVDRSSAIEVLNVTTISSHIPSNGNKTTHIIRVKRLAGKGNTKSEKYIPSNITNANHLQPWSIAFTVIGTVLLDFCSDACQSPSRTYLLDVSIPDDHTAGLSTFTMMAGFGGSIGYLMGAVHWEETFWGNLLGGQVTVVFTIVTIVFIICLIGTLSSFPEIPLSVLKDPKMYKEYQQKLHIGEFQEKGNELDVIDSKSPCYGTVSKEEHGDVIRSDVTEVNDIRNGLPQAIKESDSVEDTVSSAVVSPTESNVSIQTTEGTLKEYLRSIIHMPRSLRILCLTNLFCWMSLVSYSLYFTDFVGEVVYGGNPQAPLGSKLYNLYQDGVSFGCWGMALYSISCSVYSYFIEALVKRLGAKPVYIGGQLVYSVGMVIMAAARHPVAVILLSPTAGVMYSTLFTMPYLLIAHYHCMQKFRDDKSGGECGIRGIGTDVASVSSMVFLSQFIVSLTMGSIVEAVGSNVATVCAGALLSACGAVSATQVMYLDM